MAEHVEPWSYLKFPYLKSVGWKGFVEGVDSGVYKATPHGVETLRAWVSQPITKEDLLRQEDELMLRFAFMGAVVDDSVTHRFLGQMVQALDIIIEDVQRLGEICKRRAFETRDMLCVGRTHGIHAEPMTMGMKFGRWTWAFKRALDRLERTRDMIAVGAISGAVDVEHVDRLGRIAVGGIGEHGAGQSAEGSGVVEDPMKRGGGHRRVDGPVGVGSCR